MLLNGLKSPLTIAVSFSVSMPYKVSTDPIFLRGFPLVLKTLKKTTNDWVIVPQIGTLPLAQTAQPKESALSSRLPL